MRFEGEIVIVTGASGGLGPALVRGFLAEGARVVAVGRRADALERLLESLGRPAELSVRAADVSSAAGAEAAMRDGADVLVHAVGAWTGGHSLADAPDEELDAMLDVNYRSAWFCARAALARMAASGRGRIVLVGAVAGLQGAARAAAYAASKAAVLSLVQSVAAEGRGHGITCNAVAPGTIATEANRLAMPNADTSRWVTPEEVARVVLFLASRDAAPVTGVVVPVSRGD
jgi:NAD(P)-dependent dehydrogenase (short-subunit alcohol dehydrogenase family)